MLVFYHRLMHEGTELVDAALLGNAHVMSNWGR